MRLKLPWSTFSWHVTWPAAGLLASLGLITWALHAPVGLSFSAGSIVYIILIVAACVAFTGILVSLTSSELCRDIACMLEAIARGETRTVNGGLGFEDERLIKSVARLADMVESRFQHSAAKESEAIQLKEISSGLEVQLVSANADLTQKELRLREINRELVLANNVKTEFISNMSREIRLPLNTIIGLTDFLRQDGYGPVNEAQKEYLEKIKNRADSILYIVNHVLEYSNQGGCERLTFEDMDVSAVAEDVKASLSQFAAARRVDIKTVVHAGSLRADSSKIRYILYDLLHNAVKFNAAGGNATLIIGPADQPTVDGHAPVDAQGAVVDPPGGYLQFTISDDGPGIEDLHLDTLFRPFCQIPDEHGGKPGGAGLSLFLARKFVEMHGGRIWAESRPGLGTTFSFILPATACGAPAAGKRKRTVMVAEDDPAQLDIVKRFLNDENYDLVTASDGLEALSLADEVTPDLFLLDVVMPKMDGITVCTALKQQERYARFKHVPVVICTSLADVENRVLAIQAGADDVLSKPLNRKLMKERIKALLETKDEYENILSSYKDAEKDASIDPLTGLYNRRYLEEIMEREYMSSRRHGRDLTVMMMDLDHFKSYNDRLGHQAGDELLRVVSKTVKDIVREVDVVARYGGEEFIAILPETPPDVAAMVANRIRETVEADTGVTISIGMASYPSDSEDITGLIRNADTALYVAKDSGRNRVVRYRDEAERPLPS